MYHRQNISFLKKHIGTVKAHGDVKAHGEAHGDGSVVLFVFSGSMVYTFLTFRCLSALKSILLVYAPQHNMVDSHFTSDSWLSSILSVNTAEPSPCVIAIDRHGQFVRAG
jgi:hypothetical protein